MKSERVLLLPGWQNSGPDHWQSRWERLHGDARVEQHDWDWPRRGDWMARLDDVLLQNDAPALLVAHSLGCHLVASWAEHSQHTARVRGALLVAPPDTEHLSAPPQLQGWRPRHPKDGRARLPFPSITVISSDDPFGAAEFSLQMAQDWGSRAVMVGPRGHLNAASGLGDWPEGRALLDSL